MSKTALLAGTAMFALTTGCALAGPLPVFAAKAATSRPPQAGGNILYSQNNNYGYSIISQNFTSGSMAAYNAVAADDFVVPRGKTWKVTGVDAAGEYFFGTGPASSEIITFYKNADSHPGTVVGRPQTVNCTDTAGSFACTINRVKLTGGRKGTRYWLSVVANCNYSTCGEWGWVHAHASQSWPMGKPGRWIRHDLQQLEQYVHLLDAIRRHGRLCFRPEGQERLIR